MSNALYDHARKLLLEGNINWDNDTIHCYLVKQNTTSNVTTVGANLGHISINDRDYGTSGSGGMTLLTFAPTDNGAADGQPVTFTSVSGDTIGSVLLAQVGVDDENSPLILWLDTATGLPITPNGGDIIITWDTGVNKIFRP